MLTTLQTDAFVSGKSQSSKNLKVKTSVMIENIYLDVSSSHEDPSSAVENIQSKYKLYMEMQNNNS